MDKKLGKATMITVIENGGISINYRRIPDDPQLSQRVVLSVDVSFVVPVTHHFLSDSLIPSLLYFLLSGMSNG